MINKLSDSQINNEIKKNKLPIFGTKNEKIERLKKFYGLVWNEFKKQDNVLKNIEEIKNKRNTRRDVIVKMRKEKELKEK